MPGLEEYLTPNKRYYICLMEMFSGEIIREHSDGPVWHYVVAISMLWLSYTGDFNSFVFDANINLLSAKL